MTPWRVRQGCWQGRVVGAGATADRFAAQASMPGGPGLHSRRQGDMPQQHSAWTQSAQLAIGVMADLCPEPCIEFTESRHCLEPCLSEESRPAIEDDECDDAADAKKAAGETKKVLREDVAGNGVG